VEPPGSLGKLWGQGEGGTITQTNRGRGGVDDSGFGGMPVCKWNVRTEYLSKA